MNSSMLRQPTAHLVSLATAVPTFGLAQEDAARHAGELFAPMVSDFSRLTPIYRNAKIEQRHSCVPIDWYSQPHSFGEIALAWSLLNGLLLWHRIRVEESALQSRRGIGPASAGN